MSKGEVLVINDEEIIRETFKVILEFDDFNVKVASNGQEALDLLSSGTVPKVILLDLKMPVLNGWEFLELLENSKVWAMIPVIVVSTLPEKAQMLKTLRKFLTKPVDPEVLINVVRGYCGCE